MAKSADIVALKTGLGRTFIGVVLLATATSLPELGAGVSSIALFGEPDLAAGDIFGSNMFNLLIIGLLDIWWRSSPILSEVSISSAVVGAAGITLISIAAVAMFIHQSTSVLDGWYVSPFSLVMIVFFAAMMFIVFRVERGQEQADEPEAYTGSSLTRALILYAISAAIVVGAAVWLANTGDKLSDAMGWEASFVGTQFLAFSTSIPELAASFAAIRLRAPELAISGILGSNMFNMGFILFVDELVYTSGSIWAAFSPIHMLTAAIAILMTSIVIIALAAQQKRAPSQFWTTEAMLLIVLYVAASVLVFSLG
jgi:cation:H+ antiporter